MHFDYELTDKLGTRATIGLVTLQSDETIEHDMRRMLPLDGVAFYVSRVESAPEVTEETLARMESHLTGSARLFPLPAEFDAVGYGCTSGTSVIGAARVAEMIVAGCRTAAVTEPLSALIAACEHLGVKRLAFLSPYVEEVSATLRAAVNRAGIETPVFGSFNEENEDAVARIAPQSIIAAAEALAAKGGFDALFMSCTNLRTLDVIEEIEDRIGVPVLSSNQVLGWHLCRLSGISMAGRFGRLTA
ncbi:Asp/Glu racemase [Loktanella sp. IMCC34160]|uniref:maleate cis-trans isomerase family protein n=1 Tax=Loktanella sp. IMCC34160 TaxID=2510646 RepID=UPI00101C5B57|nr:aspartate/glutamate racemase family protein [Loktanella sp. IMCC34160]RYG91489.1 Asp/Glu racemase [Loktanella sp. IMCC34160]